MGGYERDPANATLNVIINRKVYVIELATDKEPFQSVTFYPADEPPAQTTGRRMSGHPGCSACSTRRRLTRSWPTNTPRWFLNRQSGALYPNPL
jgi:hypothetical protein